MIQLQFQAMRALKLLGEKKCTLNELADNLSICERHAQRVLKHLKDSGYDIKTRMQGRAKYFWMNADDDLLPSILTLSEKLALNSALSAQNPDLRNAVYKMTQLANVQLYFLSQK